MDISPSRKRPGAGNLEQPSQKKPHSDTDMVIATEGRTLDGAESTGQVEAREGGKAQGAVEENVTEDSMRKPSRSKAGKSITLSEAWKEDGDVGPLLASLVDLFGEGMLPFIPSKEISLFL